jgi:hypothetical protein
MSKNSQKVHNTLTYDYIYSDFNHQFKTIGISSQDNFQIKTV